MIATNTSKSVPSRRGLNSNIKCNTMGNATVQASVPSLTGWSSRRPQAPLVGALRASHSGAAYRER